MVVSGCTLPVDERLCCTFLKLYVTLPGALASASRMQSLLPTQFAEVPEGPRLCPDGQLSSLCKCWGQPLLLA